MTVLEKFDFNKAVTNMNSNRLSYSYNNYDNVESIRIDYDNIGHYTVHAVVDVLGEEYEVTFTYDSEYNIIQYDCDCIWCNDNSPCAHIGVVILKLNELDIDRYPFHYIKTADAFRQKSFLNKEAARKKLEEKRRREQLQLLSSQSYDLIEEEKKRYQNNLSALLLQEQYELYPMFYFMNNTHYLEYKIGNEHKSYIIKNIDLFLRSIEMKENVKYGKYLEFVHDDKAFNDFARRQIQFMRKAGAYHTDHSQSYPSFRDAAYYEGMPYSLGRYVNITSMIIDEFYDTYKDYDFENVTFSEIEEQIEFHMSEEDHYYIIQLLNNHVMGRNHLYRIIHDANNVTFQRLILDQDYQCVRLLKSLDNGQLVIMKDQFTDFYKYILYPIKDYLQINHINEFINDENEYEYIKIYGDIDKNANIVFKIYYVNENQDKMLAFDKDYITNYDQDVVEKYFERMGTVDYESHLVYFDSNSENTYEFLHGGLTFLKQYADIYISEGLKRYGKTVHYTVKVGIRIENDLLALDIDSVEIPKMELSKVLEQYKRKKKFYRLQNGDLLYLDSPELKELSDMMDDYDIRAKDMKDGVLTLNKNRIFSMENPDDKFEHLQINREASFLKLKETFDHHLHHHNISAYYQNILRDYQKEGLQWLKTLYDYGFNGILADDMGLGKTLQIIALIDEIASDKPSIVVCPSSLIYNWEDEIKKFAPHLKAKCIVGNADKRKQDIATCLDIQILITSYDYMRRDYEYYQDIVFEYIILDESQYIKNQKTHTAHAVKQLKGNHKLALSGTPIENSLAELWSVFDFLMPQYLFHYHYFQKNYESEIVKNNNTEVSQKLKRMVTPFILRRNKQDVLSELPDKIEMTQMLLFTAQERELYFANLAQVNSEVNSLLRGDGLDKIQLLAMLTRLRQICCEPRMIYENIEVASSKVKACMELINNYKQNNQKVLLFSSFTKVFEFMEEELRFHHISYLKIIGSTAKETRKEYVQRFQNGEADVFLISLKAGGTGLNLTKAEAVIHFDPWWNVSAQNQATDRAYRIGQNKNVQVHKLIMKDSIEEKIAALQEKKQQLADMFVENNTGSITSLSKEEIVALFALESA